MGNFFPKKRKKWLGYKQPSERCIVSGKVIYDKKGAQSSKNSRFDADHVPLRIYPCPHCSGWHLTSLNPHRKEWKKDY